MKLIPGSCPQKFSRLLKNLINHLAAYPEECIPKVLECVRLCHDQEDFITIFKPGLIAEAKSIGCYNKLIQLLETVYNFPLNEMANVRGALIEQLMCRVISDGYRRRDCQCSVRCKVEKEDGDIVMYRGTRKNIKEIDVAAHDPYYSNSGWAHFIDCKVNPSELKEDNLRFLDMLADVVPYSTRAICTAASSDTTTAMLNDLGIKTPVWVIGAEELVKLKYAKWKNLDLVFKENIGRDTIDSGDDLNEAS